MSIDQLNTDAVNLISDFREQDESEYNVKKHDNKAPVMSVDHQESILDLTDKIIQTSPIFISQFETSILRNQLKEVSLKEKIYTFKKEACLPFHHFIIHVSTLTCCKCCTIETIEKIYYLWAIDIIVNKSVTVSFIDYLEQELTNKIRDYTIQFPVTNLHIESPFSIGKVSFFFYTKEKITEIWQGFSEKQTFESFYDTVKKFQGRVFASYTTRGDSDKAIEIALRECEFAINILKLLHPANFIPTIPCLLDLDKKTRFNYSDQYFMFEGEKTNFSIKLSANPQPFKLTNDALVQAKKYLLDVFSAFLGKELRTAWDEVILAAINLFSFGLSTNDLHMRASIIISIIESILLEDDHYKGAFTNTIKARFVNILGNIKKPNVNMQNSIDHVYEIRHKMIHKGIRLPIDLVLYRDCQIAVIELLKLTVTDYKDCSNKKQFISKLTPRLE